MAVSRCLASAALLLVADGFRHIHNKDQGVQSSVADEGMSWGLTRIGADPQGRSGGGVTIFVLDTGVRVSHNEFEGRAAPAVDLTLGELRECNGDLNCAPDNRGWGTSHAGFAAGKTHGVASGALVRSVKVRTSRRSDHDPPSRLFPRLSEGLKWVATSSTRPAVALVPFAMGGRFAPQFNGIVSSAVDAAVNSGVTVVVAAGECLRGNGPCQDACGWSPSFASSAITVGSVNSADMMPTLSNWGECINLWAPAGPGLRSAWHTSDTADFNPNSNSSTASSFAAGGAALVLAADPTKSASKVLSDMSNNARRGCIGGLRGGSPNAMLWVGEGDQPPCRG